MGALYILIPLVLSMLTWELTRRRLLRSDRQKTRVLPYLPTMADQVDGEHDETTRFLAAVHEMTMAVTNAWNVSQSRSAGAQIESVIQREVLLPACAAVRAEAAAIRKRFADEAAFAEQARKCETLLRAALEHEVKESRSSLDKTRTIYTHIWQFDRDAALHAQEAVGVYLEMVKQRSLELPNVRRLTVQIEHLSVSERKFLDRLLADTILLPSNSDTPLDARTIVSQWILGARVDKWLQSADEGIAVLRRRQAELFETLLASKARYTRTSSERYISYQDRPDCLKPYQMLLSALDDCQGWNSVERMLQTCEGHAEELSRFVEGMEEVESNEAYLKVAVRSYKAAFPYSKVTIPTPSEPWRIESDSNGAALLIGVLSGLISWFLWSQQVG